MTKLELKKAVQNAIFEGAPIVEGPEGIEIMKHLINVTRKAWELIDKYEPGRPAERTGPIKDWIGHNIEE